MGRKAECAAIDRLLDGARRGSSGVLVFRGEAGVGKSALLDHAVVSASDFVVSRITGVESEIALGFAGVHQLVLPFFHRVSELPDRQRHALESVFGLADDGSPDSLLVFLAVLTLLDNAAREQPTLLVIDDAQWLDDESLRVLTFVARRLHADPMVMLFAVRDTALTGCTRLDDLPQLEIRGFSESESRQMLDRIVSGPIDVEVADHVIARTEGNALALVEFVHELTGDQLRGDVALLDPLPVSRSLQDRFAARARLLSCDSQTVLLLAAAERFGDPALLRRAAEGLVVAWDDAVAEIEAAGLARFTPTATFSHPLIRSGVYHGAGSSERRRAHRALADALDEQDDCDRRAWHLSSAAASPDEDVAGALELAATRAFQRGGTQVAAQFLLRASELTPDPVRRIDRLLKTVRLRSSEGDGARAQPVLDTVFTLVHDSYQRAEAEWTQGLIWLLEGRGRDAMRVLARAVASVERYDDGFVLDALTTAEAAAVYVGSLRESSLVEDVATIACRLLPESARLEPTELLVRGLATLLRDGYVPAAATIRAALTGLRQQAEVSGVIVAPNAPQDTNMRHLIAMSAACALLDDAALQAVARSWVDFARRARALATLPIALDVLGATAIFAGRFREAESAIAEANDILSFARSRGHIGESGLGLLLLHAHRGDEEQTRATAQLRAGDARERGSGVDLDHSHYALAVLELGWGRYAAALEHCRALDAHDPVPFSTLALPLLIEGAVRCDHMETATAALERLSQRAAASGTEWSRGVHASSRALLAEDGDAEKNYRAAISHLSRCTAAFDLARAQLLYGEWLRRRRRRLEAREPLRAALERFEQIGADAFADRTRRELTATGERSRSRSEATRDLLTGQEAQIMRLVADGRANAEIASQLYISKSTVEYHLRKIYQKLGVNSRTQLVRLGLSG